jgi:hypothetical protein
MDFHTVHKFLIKVLPGKSCKMSNGTLRPIELFFSLANTSRWRNRNTAYLKFQM